MTHHDDSSVWLITDDSSVAQNAHRGFSKADSSAWISIMEQSQYSRMFKSMNIQYKQTRSSYIPSTIWSLKTLTMYSPYIALAILVAVAVFDPQYREHKSRRLTCYKGVIWQIPPLDVNFPKIPDARDITHRYYWIISNEAPTWFNSAYIIASIMLSETNIMKCFVRSKYTTAHSGNWSLFGVNWSNPCVNITRTIKSSRHATKMRHLLLKAGDVESNPGPSSEGFSNSQSTTSNDELSDTEGADSREF